jgi:hypothetical protein
MHPTCVPCDNAEQKSLPSLLQWASNCWQVQVLLLSRHVQADTEPTKWADHRRLAQSSLLRGSTRTGQTPFSTFIYGYPLAIGYFGVVKGGGVSSQSFLGGFRGWGLVLAVWTPLREVVLIWLASRWGQTAASILRGGYTDVQGTSRR